MSRITTIKCDTCKSEQDSSDVDGWLQVGNAQIINKKIHLKDALHFCGFDCLCAWARRAANAAVKLVATADSVSPRGTFVDDELGLTY